jgi:hypothetical protein
MFWATRTFPSDSWFEVQDQFEEQWAKAGEPADMMLIYTDTPDFQMRVFVGLPDPTLAITYPGFQDIGHFDLPKRPKLLMGQPTEFSAQFPHAVR